MMAARRSRTAWLRSRAPPVDRQHPAGAFLQPRAGLDTARRRPDRPGSSPHRCIGAQTGLRAAIDPPAYPRIGGAARSCGPLSPAQTRSVACRPPISARSGAIRPSTCLRGPCRRLSGPPAAAQAAGNPPAPTRQGPPAPPPRPPAQFPAGAGTRARTYARACGVEISERRIREREAARRPRPGARSVLGRRARRGHRCPCLHV